MYCRILGNDYKIHITTFLLLNKCMLSKTELDFQYFYYFEISKYHYLK